jgi:hypothetical protein
MFPRRFPASCQFPDLFWVRKRERPGQSCLQDSFRELHLPTAAKEERHVNRVVRFRVAGHGCRIGED